MATVNNDVLIAISSGCKKLKKLTLRACIYLADDGVKALENLEHLELIDISGCLLVRLFKILMNYLFKYLGLLSCCSTFNQ